MRPTPSPCSFRPLVLAASLVGSTAAGALGLAAQQPGPERSGRVVDVERVVAELEPEIRRAMTEGRIPSLTMALVSGEDVIWSRGFGDANLYFRAPATPSTVYPIASTLKPMVAAVLLQLWEDGRLELDDPVGPYMGDLVIQGESPERPVTFRHLLTHTSGLPSAFSPVPIWADSVPTDMERYLRRALHVVGPPEERVRYSNMGFTLLAYLAERLTGVEFRTLVRDRIFDPLGMGSTEFHLTADMNERLAIPYRVEEESGTLAPTEVIRFAEWPAGGAWGTVVDQARWLAMNLNEGSYQGRRILEPATVEAGQTLQFERFQGALAGGWGGASAGYGLAWWTTTRGGERYIAHSGSVRGYTAFLHGNVDRRLGVAILTNGHRAHPHLVQLSTLATDLMARYTVAR
jgi:CubicO group peptidase (beta-lactamase class C family)